MKGELLLFLMSYKNVFVLSGGEWTEVAGTWRKVCLIPKSSVFGQMYLSGPHCLRPHCGLSSLTHSRYTKEESDTVSAPWSEDRGSQHNKMSSLGEE